MGQDSKIEWTHHTFNPWRGCTKVSAGCAHCYADTLSKRNHGALGIWGANGTRVVASEAYWREPLKWNKAAAAAGERHRVFCASLADVFEGKETMPAESFPVIRKARVRLFDLIRRTPALEWLLLTKRPENVQNAIEESLILSQDGDPDDKNYFADRDGSFPENALAWWLNDWSGNEPPANVWLGTSVEDQKAADERIPRLLKCQAAVRFLSCEPLLGAINLNHIACLGAGFVDALDGRGHDGSASAVKDDSAIDGIDWVIAGGESGPHARPMHPDWARGLRDQCIAAGVPYHFKQWGEWLPYEQDRPLRYWLGQDGSSIDVDAFPSRLSDGDPVGGWWSPVLDGVVYRRVGKHAAGRLLDGVTHDGFPQ